MTPQIKAGYTKRAARYAREALSQEETARRMFGIARAQLRSVRHARKYGDWAQVAQALEVAFMYRGIAKAWRRCAAGSRRSAEQYRAMRAAGG